ncbi:methyltransferase [Streptomyces sp. NRRL S-1868]|uniref:methyltransferase n=1 Tax=Streptomyces sp. NRRL S-1868 TaxID=1463892 RepID=UPI00068E1028|nr:methyltransferase [Streptomyces sp. NRRL S-1868]
MKVSIDVLDAIRAADIHGTHLTLTGPRMGPRLYSRVNEVLEAVGGRWTKSEQAHVFPIDADTVLAPVLESGEVVTLREKRQNSQYFPTPSPVVERLIDLAALRPGMRVLEPSAGSGAIADALRAAGAECECIERDPGYAAMLTDGGHAVRAADFLAVPPAAEFDRVVMNPPFTRGADIQHVEHAIRFLKPDGLLVSVMSWAVTDHTRQTAKFRALVEARGGSVEAVPRRAFAESGTDIDTVLVTIPAARDADVKPVVWPSREVPGAEQELRPPVEIFAEVKAAMAAAVAELDALGALLAEPLTSADTPSVELPTPQTEQLSFLDLNGDAA